MPDDISKISANAPTAPLPVPSAALEASRAHTIRVLTDRFADDTLSVVEFEAGLDRMYKATTTQQIDGLLREIEARVPQVYQASGTMQSYDVPAPRRILAIMSSTRRTGRWAMPRTLEVRAVMSDVTLDLRDVTLPAGVCEIDAVAVMADVKILVPPGVVVEEMPLNVMANIENDALDDGHLPAAAPRVRLVGFAVMANVEVRVAPAGLPTEKAWKEAKRMRRRGGWPKQ